jgi:hypothetical protein
MVQTVPQTVPWSESTITVPRTYSISRRTRPSPCRLSVISALKPWPLSLMVMVAMSVPDGAAHGHVGRPHAGREGVVIAVGDRLGDE